MTFEDYRIRRMNEYNLIVERKHIVRPKDGPEREDWKFVGYYGHPKAALRRIQKERVMDGLDRMESIDELLEWLREHAE